MTKGKFAILSAAAVVALLAGAVWAQVGFRSTTVLQTSTTVTGQPIEFPLFRNEIRAFLVEIAPGGQAGRHMHPIPTFAYILEGELSVEIDGQPPRLYRAGQAWVESVMTWHNAFNRGGSPAKFLVVYAAEEGKPTAIRP